MFEHYSYLGYTLIFCLPPIALLWGRREYARVMKKDLRGILVATGLITAYGNAVWPVAMRWGCWSYAEDRVLNLKLAGVAHLEDVVWWLLVSFLFASFTSLSLHRARSGQDVVLEEAARLAGRLRGSWKR